MISVNAEAEETKSGYLGRKEKYKRSRRDAQPFGRRVIKNLKKKTVIFARRPYVMANHSSESSSSRIVSVCRPDTRLSLAGDCACACAVSAQCQSGSRPCGSGRRYCCSRYTCFLCDRLLCDDDASSGSSCMLKYVVTTADATATRTPATTPMNAATLNYAALGVSWRDPGGGTWARTNVYRGWSELVFLRTYMTAGNVPLG